MQDTDISMTSAFETSEEVRSTFSVQKNHLWYAFASDLIPSATKIGDTTRDVPTRVEEWRSDFPDAHILGNGSLEVLPGTFVRDHALHKGCRLLGYRQLQAEDFADGIQHTTEAYDVTPECAMEVIDEVIEDIVLSHDDPETPYTYYSVEDDKKEIGVAHYARDTFDWDLRPMQQEAVDNIDDAVAMGIDTMLLDASVRFGKCFTTLAAAQRLGYRRVLVTSGKADVEGEWKKAVEKPGQFAGWSFVSPDMLRTSDDIIAKVAEESDVVVAFMTLQDSYDATEKHRYDQVFSQDWDLFVVDETHFGARAEEYGKAIKRVSRKATLHLSGSPFRILMTDEFDDDQIVACKTRADMIAERDAWNKEHADEIDAKQLRNSDNPYFGIPTPVTFALQGDAETLARIGTLKEDGVTIDLAELLATDHDAKNPSFRHEESVRTLLSMIDGEDSTFGFLRYDVAEMNDLFQHMVMCLPEKDSCDAMADLLAEMRDEGKLDKLGSYEVVNVAGNHAPKEYGAAGGTQRVVRDIATLAADKKRTITLTVYKMLTGVTVPEWDSMLMLSGMASAETYEQATGRLMSPFVQTGVNTKDGSDKMKVNRKPYVVVVDFDPARVFKMAEQRSIAQRLTGKEIDEAVEHEMRYAPIITANPDGFMRVTPTDLRREISRYATNGITEEVARIPVDNGMFNDWDFITALKDFSGNDASKKREIELDPFEEEGTELDIELPEEKTYEDKSDDAYDDYDAVGWEDDDEKALDEARRAFAAKVRDFYFRSVAFAAAWHLGQIKTLEDIRIRAKSTKMGRTIATNLGILDDIDVLCAAVGRFKNVRLQLDNAIYNISTLVNDDDLSGMEKARILMERFGRLSSSEVATPAWVAEKMVAAIPEEAFAKDEPRFLDLASKVGEMAYALVSRCARIGEETGRIVTPEVRSVTTSRVAYVLTVACYRLLGLDPHQVAQFTSYDLLGKDVETMAKTLRQDKDFYQIDLFDFMSGGNADEQTDEVEEQPVDRTGDGTTGETGFLEFDAVVSNPPYQVDAKGDAQGSSPIYPEFLELGFATSPISVFIHPARFLFNAGRTKKAWNEARLNDPFYSVSQYWAQSKDVFPDVDIKGGVAITKRDLEHKGTPIKTFVAFPELQSAFAKVSSYQNFTSFADIVYSRVAYRLTPEVYADHPELVGRQSKGHPYDMGSNVLTVLPELFYDIRPDDGDDYYQINGRRNNKRVVLYIKQKYVKAPNNIGSYKVFIPKSNGSGAIGEVLSTPLVGSPLVGSTETFISVGCFTTEDEANACMKYIKSKFARAMLGTLKTTQDNPPRVWANVPLQDFTSDSDIDWSKSIDEIDEQLFDKYDLDETEREFIRQRVAAME